MRILIVICMVLSMILPIQAFACNRIAKSYRIGLNSTFRLTNYQIGLSRTKGNLIPANTADVTHHVSTQANWIRQCNQIQIGLNVPVADTAGIRGPVGLIYQFGYYCNGTLGKNGTISGACSLLSDPIGGVVTDTVSFTAFPTSNKRFRISGTYNDQGLSIFEYSDLYFNH